MWVQTGVWQTRQRCLPVCRRWRGCWRKWAREDGGGEDGEGEGEGGGQGQPSPISHHRLPTFAHKILLFSNSKGLRKSRFSAIHQKRDKIFANN